MPRPSFAPPNDHTDEVADVCTMMDRATRRPRRAIFDYEQEDRHETLSTALVRTSTPVGIRERDSLTELSARIALFSASRRQVAV